MLLHQLNEPFKSPLDKCILAGSHMFLHSQVLTFLVVQDFPGDNFNNFEPFWVSYHVYK